MASGPPGGTDSLLEGHPRYSKIRDLGKGAYGAVVHARDTETMEDVALKFIERGPQNVNKYVEREILNHMKLRHPHIIGLREVFLTANHLVLAMEFAAGGDLFKYVSSRKSLGEPEARWFFQQLIVGIDYCHRMGVASRDIKLENTLLDGSPRPLIKLADFGFSKDDQQSAPTSRVGTPAYLAPEVIVSKPGTHYDGKKADLWSCGVLLYILVTGTYPFQRVKDSTMKGPQKLNAILNRILAVDYIFPERKRLSPECKDLISSLLVLDPNARPDIPAIQAHPWYRVDLNPAALSFNDTLVADSLANATPDSVYEDIRSIVRDAQQVVRGKPQHADENSFDTTLGSMDLAAELLH
ncbi:hypothetical protein ACKKBG_A04765 [Auxenochlorella protothecoides x Auxenochlorella symbiontica]|uniref:Protein kinase domain-containing protein n=1 Tax=Auxenochlorella protothecoides TaxID=3075 RepID=A0A1D1ZND6_AUXPR